ncbi:MAG: hypothetical protein K5639_02670 [Eubacterium sp.]|nr:hypothetical protein [Eubacterium sp.]
MSSVSANLDAAKRGEEIFDKFCEAYPFDEMNRYIFVLKNDPEWIESLNNILPEYADACPGSVFVFVNPEKMNYNKKNIGADVDFELIEFASGNDMFETSTSKIISRLIFVEMDDSDIWAFARFAQSFAQDCWWNQYTPFKYITDWECRASIPEEVLAFSNHSLENYIRWSLLR